MGFFDRKDKPKADFSNVQSGSSTRPDVSSPADAARSYTVKAGDTLSGIAKNEYGDAGQWKRIFEANRDKLDNPDLIHPGQVLKIPTDRGAL